MKLRIGKVMQVLGMLFIVLLFGSCLLPYALHLSTEDSLWESPYSDGAFVQVDDVRIHYRLVVPNIDLPKGKILLVHGLGASVHSFQAVIPALVEAGYVIVAVDLPGFGYSGRAENFDHSQVNRATVLWQLLETVDSLEEPWTLVGHSMGGGTVAAMALSRPEKTASLVLVAGALEDFAFADALILKFPPISRWAQLYVERTLLKENQVKKILYKAYNREADEEEIQAYLEPLQLPGTARGLISFAKTSRALPMDDLSTLQMPVLAIWGDNDTVVPLDKALAIVEKIEQLQLSVLQGAAHIPMETHPEQFNSTLLTFLHSLVP